jgi:N-acetylmuramoyl-L-alanine amidase
VIVDRDEERQFRDPAYRERIARALSRAVTAFAETSR